MNKILGCLFFSCQFLFCSQRRMSNIDVAKLYTYDEEAYILAPNEYVAYRIEALRRVDIFLAKKRALMLAKKSELQSASNFYVDDFEFLTMYEVHDKNNNVLFQGSEISGNYTFMQTRLSLFLHYSELIPLLLIVRSIVDNESLSIPVAIYGKNGVPFQDSEILFTRGPDGVQVNGHASSNRQDNIDRPRGFAKFRKQDTSKAIKLDF